MLILIVENLEPDQTNGQRGRWVVVVDWSTAPAGMGAEQREQAKASSCRALVTSAWSPSKLLRISQGVRQTNTRTLAGRCIMPGGSLR